MDIEEMVGMDMDIEDVWSMDIEEYIEY